MLLELIAILAVWRLSSLLVMESGPFEMFARLRQLLGVRYDQYNRCTSANGKGLLPGILCCIWCCSMWVSIPAAAALALYQGGSWFVAALNWLALSAGAIMVDRLVR